MTTDNPLRRDLARDFDDVLAAMPAALRTEGFGVLTEIDMQKTLDVKLGVAFRRYRIIGACNPSLAFEALSADLGVGLSLPCNVVVYEGDPGHTTVLAVDPAMTVAAGNPALAGVAAAVRDKLGRALAQLAGG